jgi:hypothetical protein
VKRGLILVLVLFPLLAAQLERGTAAKQPAATPVVSPVTAAGADVPMYRANPARTGVMPGPGPEGEPIEL